MTVMLSENDAKLGTLEFIQALSGDDEIKLISILKRFIKTVREERVLAFSSDSNTYINFSGSASDDEDVTSSQPPKKRSKVDIWKLDVKSYNVPFVGTSIIKGNTGFVEKGQWPTGFLSAYLNRSPNAIELLDIDTQSPLVLRFYIEAIAELATCSLSPEIIKSGLRHRTSSIRATITNHQCIISSIMKNHFISLIRALNDHSRQNRSSNDSVDDIRSEKIVIASLNTLSVLACTSMGTAREIARGLDGIQEGALRSLLRSPAPKKNVNDNVGDNVGDNKKDTDINKSFSGALMRRSACLDLTCTLLETNDPVVLSYTTNMGGQKKENKRKCGVVYTALRTISLDDNLFSNDEIPVEAATKISSSLCRLLQAIRTNMLQSEDIDNCNQNKKHLSSNSYTQLEFFKGEVFDLLAELSRRKFQQSGNDNNEQSKTLVNNIYEECHQVVEVLLSDSLRSPFLIYLKSKDSPDKTSIFCLQKLCRYLHMFLTGHPAKVKQNFVICCLKRSPILLPTFFRTIQIPEIKPTIKCISTFSFISQLLSEGTWTRRPMMPQGSGIDAQQGTLEAEQFISRIIPNSLTVNSLSKALQSSSAIFVAESLKLLLFMLRQTKFLYHNASDDVMEAIQRRLPDLQVFLSIKMKFDPFKDGNDFAQSRQNSAVIMILCEILQLYSTLFTSTLASVQFDWAKLLPENMNGFDTISIVFQHKIFTTISYIYDACKISTGRTLFLASRFRMILSLMHASNSHLICSILRKIALKYICDVLSSDSCLYHDVIKQHLEYESLTWIDGSNEKTIANLSLSLDAMSNMKIYHSVLVSQAWKTYFPSEVGNIAFSPLLSLSLFRIASKNDSLMEDFTFLVCRVAMRMLFYVEEPLQLACVIMKAFSCDQSLVHLSKHENEKVQYLKGFAASMIKTSCNNLHATYFGKGHFVRQCLYYSNSNMTQRGNILRSGLDVLMKKESADNLLSCQVWSLVKASHDSVRIEVNATKDSFDFITRNDFVEMSVEVRSSRRCMKMKLLLSWVLLKHDCRRNLRYEDGVQSLMVYYSTKLSEENSHVAMSTFLLKLLRLMNGFYCTQAQHIKILFCLWEELSKMYRNSRLSIIDKRILVVIEDILIAVLNSGNHAPLLLLHISRSSPASIVECVLNNQEIRSETTCDENSTIICDDIKAQKRTCLLVTLLESDPSLFGTPVMNLLLSKLTNETWKHTFWYNLVSTLVRELTNHKKSGVYRHTQNNKILGAITKHICKLMEKNENFLVRDSIYFELLVQVNQNDVDIDLLWKKVTAFIERCSKKKDRIGLVPLYALQAMASSIRHNLPLLQNSSFQYCCNSGITYFGAILRSQLRDGKEKESRIMLEAILSLITVIDSMKEQYVPMHDNDAIKRMLINCLKHGIND